ncbi:hypothetical protein YC2023_075175 [Brassica napus]
MIQILSGVDDRVLKLADFGNSPLAFFFPGHFYLVVISLVNNYVVKIKALGEEVSP